MSLDGSMFSLQKFIVLSLSKIGEESYYFLWSVFLKLLCISDWLWLPYLVIANFTW